MNRYHLTPKFIVMKTIILPISVFTLFFFLLVQPVKSQNDFSSNTQPENPVCHEEVVWQQLPNSPGLNDADLLNDNQTIEQGIDNTSALGKCDMFTNVTCGYSQTHSTVGAGNEFVLADYPGLPTTSAFDGPDLLFRLQITTKTNVQIVMNINTIGKDLDMFLLTNCLTPTMKSYTGEPNASIYKEVIDVNLDPGFYFIVVDGYNSAQAGSFTLSVDCTATALEPSADLTTAYKYWADDFENYTTGTSLDNQSNRWRKWNTTSTNGAIVLPETLNKFARFNYSATPPDMIYELNEGNTPTSNQPITSGRWRLSWSMYVGPGKTGYCNVLHKKPDNSGNGAVWAYELYFNRNSPNQGELKLPNSTVTYKTFYIPSDLYFNVVSIIDMAKDSAELWINDVYVGAWKFSVGSGNQTLNQLDGINFYAGRVATDDFYLDRLTVWRQNALLNCNDQTLSDPVCVENGKRYNGAAIAGCNLYSSLEYDFCESICDFGGTFIYRGQNFSGSFDYSDRAPGQLRNMQCVKDAYGGNVPPDLYSDIYIFYHDDVPNVAFFEWPASLSPNTKAFLMKCSAFIEEPNLGRNSETVSLADTCIHFANCLNELYPFVTNLIYFPFHEHNECDNFYYIVVTGTLGETYSDMQITPGGPCPDDVPVLSCGTQQEFGITNYSPLLSDQYFSNVWFDNAYDCYSGARDYVGGEAFYKLELDSPKKITVTLQAAEPMGVFLFSFLCGRDCIQYAGTLPGTGTAILNATLDNGTYYLVVDKDFSGGDESFLISLDCQATTLSGPNIFTVKDFEESPNCPPDFGNQHQITIPNLITAYSRFDTSDLVQFLFPLDFGGIKSTQDLTRRWTELINNEQAFPVYGDQTGDNNECGFTMGEKISIRQIQADNEGARRLTDYTVQYAPPGGGNNAQENFITDGISQVIKLIPKPTVTFGVSGNEKLLNRFTNDSTVVEFNSNLPWAVSIVDNFPVGTGGWLHISKVAGAEGPTTIKFTTLAANDTYQPRSVLLKFYAVGYEDNYFQYMRVVQAGICSSIQGLNVTATPSNTICAGDSITLTATASGGGILYNYYWQNTGEEKRIIKIAPQNSGSYTVIVTNPNYCDAFDTRSVYITVKDPPSVTATGGTLTCSSSSITLNVATNAASPTYFWQGPNGFTSTLTTPIVSVAGIYTVTVTPSTGCTGSATAVVVGNNIIPVVTTSVSGTITCAISSVTISASTTNTPNPRFNWSGPGGFVSDQPVAVVSAAGNYIVTVTNQSNGCIATASVTVNSNMTLPTVNTSASGLILCTMAPVQITATSNAPNASFQWAGPFNFSSNLQSPFVTNAGTYTVLVTNLSNGCSTPANLVVQSDNSVPDAAATGGTVTCANPQINLVGTSGSNGVSYLWTGPNNFNVPNQTTVPVTTAGIYTFKVTFNASGCSKSVSVTVLVDKTPPGAIAPGGNITCSSPIFTLTGSTSNPANVTWNWAGPNGFNSNLQNPNVNAGGNYVLTTASLSNGCTSTATAVVEENKIPPTAGIATPGSLSCSQTSLQLNGSPSSQGPTFLYIWTTSNGNIVSGVNTLTPTINQVGTYTLMVTNTANGCTKTASVTVIGNINLPQANAGVSQTITCLSPTVQLNGSASTGADFQSSWTGPGIIANGNTLSPTVNTPGNYVLTVQNTSTLCVNTDTVTVLQNIAIPDITLPPSPTLSCANNSAVEITATSNDPGVEFEWFSPGNTSIGNSATVLVNVAGTYTLIARLTSSGCTVTEQLTVTGNADLPTGGAGGNKTVCEGDSWVMGLGNSPDFLYQWSPASAFSNPNAPSPTITPLANQVYSVTITNPVNQCSKIDQAEIKVSPNMYVYFTVANELKCHGDANGTIIVTGGGGTPPYSYEWSNGSISQQLTNLSSGIYTITVADQAGCSKVQPVGLSEPDAIILAGYTVSQPSGGNPNSGFISISPSGGVGPYTFKWYKDGIEIPNETNPILAGLSIIVGYTVLVIDSKGCSISFGPFGSSAAVEPEWAAAGVRLYPNPTDALVNLQLALPEANSTVEVRSFDMLGREIHHKKETVLQTEAWLFDFSAQQQGIYLLKICVNESVTLVRKIVVVR